MHVLFYARNIVYTYYFLHILFYARIFNFLGLDCLRGLVELDVRNNELKRIEELAKISSLLHMRILALTGMVQLLS